MKRIGKWLEERPIRSTVIFSFITYFLMEVFSRHSLIGTVLYLLRRPHLFYYNVLIIVVTVSVCMFFKKRLFVMILISMIWLIMGMVNGILLFFRTTPFSFNDLSLLSTVFSIITVYMRIWQIVLVGVVLLLLIAGLVVLCIFSPKWSRQIVRGVLTLAVGGAVLAYVTYLYFANGIIAKKVYNIADAYKDYGFVVCYSESIFVRGVNRPDTYSVRTVRDIAKMLNLDEKKDEEIEQEIMKPNIIFLQLESFFDPYHLEDVEYSMDPIPYFRELKETCSSGYLSVPSFGAGTANTEFEILTGMNLEYFGPGEYPFSTILRQKTCESMAYDLKDLGYSSHMIHNNSGSFYGRNLVYPNLGFDTFNSLEYMHNVKVNPLGWAKDSILTEQIIQSLKSTDEQDLVYTISVQGHGKYPEDNVDEFMSVQLNEDANGWTPEEIYAFTYYVNQIRQMDTFLEELTSVLAEFDEPTVLVAYGDHLPDFNFTAEQMDNRSLYQTEYVIWSNFGMESEDLDMESYQLSAYVMDRLGFHNGILTRLHQLGDENSTYQADLEMLEHDMLYGEQIIFSGVSPYMPSDIQMGTEEIVIKNAEYDPETRELSVNGENFTKWSQVYVNGQEQATIYESRQTLKVENIDISEEDKIFVAQQTDEKEILSSTLEYYMLDLEDN